MEAGWGTLAWLGRGEGKVKNEQAGDGQLEYPREDGPGSTLNLFSRETLAQSTLNPDSQGEVQEEAAGPSLHIRGLLPPQVQVQHTGG